MADPGQAAASSSAETEEGRVREAVGEWRDVLMSDPLIVELIRQSDDEVGFAHMITQRALSTD